MSAWQAKGAMRFWVLSELGITCAVLRPVLVWQDYWKRCCVTWHHDCTSTWVEGETASIRSIWPVTVHFNHAERPILLKPGQNTWKGLLKTYAGQSGEADCVVLEGVGRRD